MKSCTKCGAHKPFSKFYRDKKRSDGLQCWCKECQYESRNEKSYPQRIRILAMEALGNKCSNCGFSDHRALQIDHKNGGGTAERKKLGQSGVYLRIVNGDTEGYQILCANCNWIKRYENNECKAGSV